MRRYLDKARNALPLRFLRRLVPFIIAAIVVAVTASFGLDRERGLVIQARTGSIELTVTQKTSVDLPVQVSECTADPRFSGLDVCPLTLLKGTKLRVSTTIGGDLVIEPMRGEEGKIRQPCIADTDDAACKQHAIEFDTQIIVPYQKRVGPFYMHASDIVIGSPPRSSQLGFLRSATYSFLEPTLFGGGSATVRSGDLPTGDIIKVVHSDGENTSFDSFVFIDSTRLNQGDKESGGDINVTINAPFGDPTLYVNRSGREILMEPNWTDRALKDPLLLGTTSLLTLVFFLYQVSVLLLGKTEDDV